MSGFRDDLYALLGRFADVPEAVRVLKIGEEFGEATEAFIGLRAYNPRKGRTHSHDEVADELADVAITALVAMGAFTVDPIQRLTNRMRYVVERLSQPSGIKCFTHDTPDCPLCIAYANRPRETHPGPQDPPDNPNDWPVA